MKSAIHVASAIKIKPRSWWKKRADEWFSKYIRSRDDGKCYTCPRHDNPKRMQCGHFVPRQYLATRYSEINCHTQCYACNMLYNGQPSAFALNLKRDYGEEIIKSLEDARQVLMRNMDYEVIAKEYKKKYEDLVNCG